MGGVPGRRRHPALMATGAPRSRVVRLCGGARSRPPRAHEPFGAILEPGYRSLSAMAGCAPPPGSGGRRPADHQGAWKLMRILHTMLRVGDMQRSVRFYTEVLGMKLLRSRD